MIQSWREGIPGACRSEAKFQVLYVQGASSTAVALCLSILPMVFFANLQLGTRNRVVVCILMGLGVINGLCSLVRCTLVPTNIISLDPTYTPIPVTIMGSLELSLAIIAACIPTLRPLFHFFDDSKTGGHHTSGQAFLKQNKTAQDGAAHSNQALAGGAQCIPTSFELSHNDSRSERSTQELSDLNTIRKTAESSVTV
ncbi:hypothetical protein N7G274_000226 [Stereocaulon virgatum]|uniref:Rhodopsin domain-containing protein n=1 Tax=Stereocaulon virgatum TaxID=373712 RepID=A0ABR4ASU7_9LECA